MKNNRFLKMVCLPVLFPVMVFAQDIVVKGTVTDSSKNPLIGVSVQQKKTNNATFTDVNGNYWLKAKKGQTLVFKFIGFEAKEVKVKDSVINVVLKEDTQILNEVVAVGYCIETKKDFTGSTSNVLNTSVSTALQGKVAGVRIASNYGYNCLYQPVMNTDNTEEYGTYKENRFIPVLSEALSTFSLDVDAASYSNVRRMINQGQMPPKDAVRIEEMINYFSYSYPQPKGDHPVSIVTELADCPWNATHKLVRIGVKALEIPSEKLPASNFVFLIDVSGSMMDVNKLDLVKSSLKLLTNNLRNNDRVSIVVYAGAAGEVLPSTSGNDKQKIREAIDNLSAGGSTAGGAGIQLAYKIARKNFITEGNNRIILCTDGDFNVGVSSNSELESLIESERKSGVYLTILGYGMGNYKDSKLQTLAEKGNGNHAYIDNLQEANKVLVNEFGSTMYTVVKDVKIQVEFNPAQVNAYRLVGYESRLLNKEDFNDDTKDAGELGSGHTVTALYEIIPFGIKDGFGSVDPLKYQKEPSIKPSKTDVSAEMLTVKLRYKNTGSNKSALMEIPLIPDNTKKEMTKDFSFAAAVAMFGQLLKNSDFKGDATYDKVIALAKKGFDNDDHGYRREFIRLVEAAGQLEK